MLEEFRRRSGPEPMLGELLLRPQSVLGREIIDEQARLTSEIHRDGGAGGPNEITVVGHAMRWWRANGAPLEAGSRPRLLRLAAVLGLVDKAYERQRVVRLRTPKGRFLMLGRLWWQGVARALAPARDQGAPEAPFPHLRYDDYRDHEWLSSRAITGAFERCLGARGARTSKLRVGLCSLSGRMVTLFQPTELLSVASSPGSPAYGFRADRVVVRPAFGGDDVNTAYREEFNRCVAWAVEQKVNVLLLPELCLCARGREILRETIEAASRAGAADLCMVIPGSFHELSDTGSGAAEASPYNVAPIWVVRDDGQVQLVSTYAKAVRFRLECSRAAECDVLRHVADAAKAAGCAEVLEDVDADALMRFIDTPVGVIAVSICKDALHPFARDRAGRVADHVLVISMNAAPTDEFWTGGKELGRQHYAATFYVNCRQALPAELPKHIAQVPELAYYQFPIRIPDLKNRRFYPVDPPPEESSCQRANDEGEWVDLPIPLELVR